MLTPLTPTYWVVRVGTVRHGQNVLPGVKVEDRSGRRMAGIHVTFTVRRAGFIEVIKTTGAQGMAWMDPWKFEPGVTDTVVATAHGSRVVFLVVTESVSIAAAYDLISAAGNSVSGRRIIFFADSVLEYHSAQRPTTAESYVKRGSVLWWQVETEPDGAIAVTGRIIGDTLQVDYDDYRAPERYIQTRNTNW